jgi:hypothetical protein
MLAVIQVCAHSAWVTGSSSSSSRGSRGDAGMRSNIVGELVLPVSIIRLRFWGRCLHQQTTLDYTG